MRFFSNIYVKHGILAIVIFLTVIFFLKKWLDVYTRHDQQVEIPDVKGLEVKEIDAIFKQKKLCYVIADSIFVNGTTPGSILKTTPPIGTKVKPNRVIYLTINSYEDLLLTIPSVKDMSRRQAQSLLQSIGFKDVQTKTVCGTYKNLVTGIETKKGNKLTMGDHVSANTPLVILVSSGIEEVSSVDSTAIDKK